ncbi:sensor histidine kinase [Babesia caballi]|uniref:Sensor histidine kinase n=1 Tax=Babesia caballi TaxID=5871 RepID=A0AAV4LVU0_BABCB|nr:sensor histidine kinase [Babesia caballi]
MDTTLFCRRSPQRRIFYKFRNPHVAVAHTPSPARRLLILRVLLVRLELFVQKVAHRRHPRSGLPLSLALQVDYPVARRAALPPLQVRRLLLLLLPDLLRHGLERVGVHDALHQLRRILGPLVVVDLEVRPLPEHIPPPHEPAEDRVPVVEVVAAVEGDEELRPVGVLPLRVVELVLEVLGHVLTPVLALRPRVERALAPAPRPRRVPALYDEVGHVPVEYRVVVVPVFAVLQKIVAGHGHAVRVEHDVEVAVAGDQLDVRLQLLLLHQRVQRLPDFEDRHRPELRGVLRVHGGASEAGCLPARCEPGVPRPVRKRVLLHPLKYFTVVVDQLGCTIELADGDAIQRVAPYFRPALIRRPGERGRDVPEAAYSTQLGVARIL